ncbi:MAG: signal peptidase I [Bacteroidetes bacterium]|nr:signal peptidase I [Bacteroidota bacterium]
MKWNPFKKLVKQKPKPWLQEWRDSIVFAVVVATLFRWSLVEAFVIPTPSMENSLLVGDFLFVSKFHYGTRTPRTPLQIPLTHQKIWGTEIPSYLTWIQLPPYRLPGLREVRRGEPVVFNVPKDLLDKTERPVDLKTYLVKRCVGVHGDKLEIRNKQVFINGKALTNPVNMKFSYLVIAKDEIHKRHLDNLELNSDDYTYLGRTPDASAAYNMSLTHDQMVQIKSLSFIRSVENSADQSSAFPIFPSLKKETWSRDNYGPLIIPEKGMKMIVNDSTLNIYGEIIKLYERHEKVAIERGRLIIDGKEISDYKFAQNYYFMMGDNRDNSLDSRYWGFVPEDHILGKPLFIWFSIDNEARLLNKIRWSRLFNVIE